MRRGRELHASPLGAPGSGPREVRGRPAARPVFAGSRGADHRPPIQLGAARGSRLKPLFHQGLRLSDGKRSTPRFRAKHGVCAISRCTGSTGSALAHRSRVFCPEAGARRGVAAMGLSAPRPPGDPGGAGGGGGPVARGGQTRPAPRSSAPSVNSRFGSAPSMTPASGIATSTLRNILIAPRGPSQGAAPSLRSGGRRRRRTVLLHGAGRPAATDCVALAPRRRTDSPSPTGTAWAKDVERVLGRDARAFLRRAT